MRPLLLIVPLLLALVSCTDTPSRSEPVNEITDSISAPQIIDLSGSGYERGLQHGTILRDQIEEIV